MSGRPGSPGRNAAVAHLAAAIVGAAASASSSSPEPAPDWLGPQAREHFDAHYGDTEVDDEDDSPFDEDGLAPRDYDTDVRDDR